MEDDRFVLRSITDEIMYELMELSGQEYVDVYAATMKERLAAARRSAKPSIRGAAARVPVPASDPGEQPATGPADPSPPSAA